MRIKNFLILRIAVKTALTVLTALLAGFAVAQLGLSCAPTTFTTLVGTAIVSGVMVGVGLLVWFGIGFEKEG